MTPTGENIPVSQLVRQHFCASAVGAHKIWVRVLIRLLYVDVRRNEIPGMTKFDTMNCLLHFAQYHFLQNISITAGTGCIIAIFNLKHIYILTREAHSTVYFTDKILYETDTLYVYKIRL